MGYDEDGQVTRVSWNIKLKNRPKHMKIILNRTTGQGGFTFIELIMVVVLIGILSSIVAEKMQDYGAKAELAIEATTIDLMRTNLINNFGIDMINGITAKFPDNPFANLHKAPDGYTSGRSTSLTGADKDAELWVFVPGGGGGFSTEDAGTTLSSFNATGLIFHQRIDGTVALWPYDSNIGIIGRRKSVQSDPS